MISKNKIFILFISLPLFFLSLSSNLFAEESRPTPEQTILEFLTIANDYEKSLFEYSPELGLFWGRLDIALDRFKDFSIKRHTEWLQQEDVFLARLYQLNAKDLENTPQYLTYLLLKETLEAQKKSRICHEELWDVNPSLFGWHNQMTVIAQKQPVGTKEYRMLALKRWKTFDKVVDAQINNLKLGLEHGITAPEPAVKNVLAQLHILSEIPMEESPYFDFARRDGDEIFKSEVEDLIKTVIYPSLKKYTDYLENEYILKARSDIGVSALPEGDKCYEAKLKQETTLNLTPHDIHTLGLQTLEKIAAEVGDIGFKKYGTRDVTLIFQRAKNESMSFSTEEDILNYNLAALEKAKNRIPEWFSIEPKTPGIIKAYPEHRAKTGASGEYYPPSENGTTPGIFYINTYEPTKRSRIDEEATLFHELIPGHHFQVAFFYENKTLPTLNRYLVNAGFAEGWALYAERLADEMGLYQDDISRLGMLSNESLRAARLVVDTGIHVFHWNREKAIDYLKAHTALNENIIEGEVDRYIMNPGQATAYFVGKNEIQTLRHLAEEKLRKHFDIREFHNEVLKNGMVSLSLLRTCIEKWIKENE